MQLEQLTESDQIITQATLENHFFQDFLLFLRSLQTKPMGLTQTGNLKLTEIDYLAKKFKIDIYHRDKEGNIIYPIRSEYDVFHLQRIRLIIRVMQLAYKRKGKLNLSPKGKVFLSLTDPKEQFHHILNWYFYRCNWAYLHYYVDDLAELLQDQQRKIWEYLLYNKYKSLEIMPFVEGIRAFFNLEEPTDYRDRVQWAITSMIIEDLGIYGLITTQTASFQLTPLGVHMLSSMEIPT